MRVIGESGVVLAILKEKDIFGEIAFVYGSARSASVVAREDSELLILDKTLIENLSKTDPAIKYILIENMMVSVKDKLINANSMIEKPQLIIKNKKPLQNQNLFHIHND